MRRRFVISAVFAAVAAACVIAVGFGLSESNIPDPIVSEQQCKSQRTYDDLTMMQAKLGASEESRCTQP